MTKEEIDKFEKIQSQLEGLHQEIGALSRKTPNDGVNKFKLGFINKALSDANDLMGENDKPFPDFDTFDVDELPTNSDVTMIVGQYISCLEKLRADNIYQDFGKWYWRADDDKSGIRTYPPVKLKK